MGRQPGLVLLRRYCRCDDGGTVSVADVVLNDKYRPHSALLAAHDGAEVGIIYLTALYINVQ